MDLPDILKIVILKDILKNRKKNGPPMEPFLKDPREPFWLGSCLDNIIYISDAVFYVRSRGDVFSQTRLALGLVQPGRDSSQGFLGELVPQHQGTGSLGPFKIGPLI